MEPTLADLYDRAMGNRPVVGEIGTVSIHSGCSGTARCGAAVTRTSP
jgi:hypothetical protein